MSNVTRHTGDKPPFYAILRVADVFHHIMQFLTPQEIISTSLVCRKARRVLHIGDVVRKITWSQARGLPYDKTYSVDEHERRYQEIGIEYPRLIQILGGLHAVYELPQIRLNYNIQDNIHISYINHKITRGRDRDDKPFITFRYVIWDPLSTQTIRSIETIFQAKEGHHILWKAARVIVTPQVTLGIKQINAPEVEEVALARIEKLVTGEPLVRVKRKPLPGAPIPFEEEPKKGEFTALVQLY
ncbi:MAG: F-box protein [Waddliaceae bacterium]